MTDRMLVTLTTDDLRSLVLSCVAEALEGAGGLQSASGSREWLTRAEAADYLRCSLATLDRLVAAGELPVHRLGESPRFRLAELFEAITRPVLTDGGGDVS